MPLPSLPALPTWAQTKTGAKAGFDKVYHVVDKLGPPVNKLSNKLGAEAFWPTTLDKESDKAARILRSFCKDGFYIEEKDEAEAGSGEAAGAVVKKDGVPRGKQRVLKKIPMSVIKEARGIAIFTTMRTGLWFSGAGGAGVLVAKMADGRWSPPSGIMLHTAGLGALVGADIYDCVAIINTDKALEAFMKIRCTLGGEVSAVAGPVGIGGVLETEVHKRQAPVWNYIKSRGFYAGVQIDGTVIIERTDENERFYGEKIGVGDILAGKARHPPREINGLINTLKAAQGDTDIDESALPSATEPIPSDYEFRDSQFGVPETDDPDPFGVKALEEQGMVIREAGSGQRPSMDVFNFSPSPKSPIYNTFHSRKNSKRDSVPISIASTVKTDMATQTDDLPSPRFTDSPRIIDSPTSPRRDSPVKKTSENLAEEVDDSSSDQDEAIEPVKAQRISQISQAGATTVSPGKLKVVTIPKRVPPALPPRSPYRSSRESIPLSSPPLLPSRTSTDISRGLGIDIGTRTEDVGTQSLHATNTQDTIPSIERDIVEERLHHIHPVPSRDSRRLSPHRDGFEDVASVSGSEYSRPTSKAETPAMSRVVSTDGASIVLYTPVVKQTATAAAESLDDQKVEAPIELRDTEHTEQTPVDSSTHAAADDTPIMPGGAVWDTQISPSHTPALAPAKRSPSPNPSLPTADAKLDHPAPTTESSTIDDIRASLNLSNGDANPRTPSPHLLHPLNTATASAEPEADQYILPIPAVTSPLLNIRRSLNIDDEDDAFTAPTPPQAHSVVAEDDFHSVPQTPIVEKPVQASVFDAGKMEPQVLKAESVKKTAESAKVEETPVVLTGETKTDVQEKEENVKPNKALSEFEKKRAMFS